MRWRGPFAWAGVKPRDFWRSTIMLACPAGIIWLGSDSIAHINELYDGLCPVQGQGLAPLLYDDNPLGYCVGVSAELQLLGFIMVVAAIAVPCALGAWWRYTDDRIRKSAGLKPPP
jgi:hypothetical protein